MAPTCDGGRLLFKILVVGLAISGMARPVVGFDTPKAQWPKLLTSQGEPVKVAESIKESIRGSVDLLVTGIPMTDEELRQVYEVRGVRLLHIATAVTAAVPCFRLDGVDRPLNFSAEALSGIFLGHITNWNDPALAAQNPGVKLPSARIVLIGHAGEDGSTYAWSNFLSNADREWRESVGSVRTLSGPLVLARGKSEDEVAALVRQTPNSLSYVELWAAKGRAIKIGRVRNQSGRFIEPSPASISAAAASASSDLARDARASFTHTTGVGDYPVAVCTWIVVPEAAPQSERRSLVLSLVKWILTEGQKSTEGTFYGQLPEAVLSQELRRVEGLR